MRLSALFILLGYLAAPASMADAPQEPQEASTAGQEAGDTEAAERRKKKEAEKARRKAQRAKCSCTTWPFSPDPPCFDHCATRVIASADASVLAEVLGLSANDQELLATVRSESGKSSSSLFSGFGKKSTAIGKRNAPVLDVTDERVQAFMERLRKIDPEDADKITKQFTLPLFK